MLQNVIQGRWRPAYLFVEQCAIDDVKQFVTDNFEYNAVLQPEDFSSSSIFSSFKPYMNGIPANFGTVVDWVEDLSREKSSIAIVISGAKVQLKEAEFLLTLLSCCNEACRSSDSQFRVIVVDRAK